MSGHRNDGGREAVSWLATGIVCFLGILFCGFIVLMFAKNPEAPILTMSSVFVGFAVLLWLLREKPSDVIGEEESKWFGLFRKPKPTMSLKLHRRKPQRQRSPNRLKAPQKHTCSKLRASRCCF